MQRLRDIVTLAFSGNGQLYHTSRPLNSAMQSIKVPDDLEGQIDDLVAQGMFRSVQEGALELIRLGLASIRGERTRAVPPSNIPQPERPNIPDPSRDILRM